MFSHTGNRNADTRPSTTADSACNPFEGPHWDLEIFARAADTSSIAATPNPAPELAARHLASSLQPTQPPVPRVLDDTNDESMGLLRTDTEIYNPHPTNPTIGPAESHDADQTGPGHRQSPAAGAQPPAQQGRKRSLSDYRQDTTPAPPQHPQAFSDATHGNRDVLSLPQGLCEDVVRAVAEIGVLGHIPAVEVLQILSQDPTRPPAPDWKPLIDQTLRRMDMLTHLAGGTSTQSLIEQLRKPCEDRMAAEIHRLQTLAIASATTISRPTPSVDTTSSGADRPTDIREYVDLLATKNCRCNGAKTGPYRCLRPGCLATFASKLAWLRHNENWDPYQLWRCLRHPGKFYHRPERLNDHFTKHDSLPFRKEVLLTPMKARRCPVCGKSDDDWDNFYRNHVARCMERQAASQGPTGGPMQPPPGGRPDEHDDDMHDDEGGPSRPLHKHLSPSHVGHSARPFQAPFGAPYTGSHQRPNGWSVLHLLRAAQWFTRRAARGELKISPETLQDSWQVAIRDKVLTFVGTTDPMTKCEMVLVNDAQEDGTTSLSYLGAMFDDPASCSGNIYDQTLVDLHQDVAEFQSVTFDAASDSGYGSEQCSRSATALPRPESQTRPVAATPSIAAVGTTSHLPLQSSMSAPGQGGLMCSHETQPRPLADAMADCQNYSMAGYARRKRINGIFEMVGGEICRRYEGSISRQARSRPARRLWLPSSADIQAQYITEGDEDTKLISSSGHPYVEPDHRACHEDSTEMSGESHDTPVSQDELGLYYVAAGPFAQPYMSGECVQRHPKRVEYDMLASQRITEVYEDPDLL
ncbi:hypothetical protein FH972_024175 [Carpinus fangiana]|uniref:Uncharacterized protein n=1 Tax=Carpinus fangiana TaxID=176857 RepID=A0A5N6KX98_9ROSI|nr:hypothetical protein FH972_024175 [Carpinus fangiana]